MVEKIDIPAIHDDDLKVILEKHGLLHKLEQNELQCVFCNNIITWDNVYALTIKDGEPILVCDSVDCVNSLYHRNG